MSRVVVGMSGGVDSSVTAYLLKQRGYEVIGITMRTWESDAFAPGKIMIRDCERICGMLDIKHAVLDYHTAFQKQVIQYFVEEYGQGRTPNPCVFCNRQVKWEVLLDAADKYQAEYIATGHYAEVVKRENGRYALKRALNLQKDQTYALYRLSQAQLSRAVLPLGQYQKEAVRSLAEGIGLPVADKPDSQENCFIPDGDYAGFIERYLGRRFPEGNFVDAKGTVLGRHKGIIHYTIGQRKGLGIAFGVPLFVTGIRAEANEVVLGTDEEVWTDSLTADGLQYMAVPAFEEGKVYTAKIRYNHSGAACTVSMLKNGMLACRFPEPVRAATPGQAIVLYDGAYVAGGGTITHPISGI